MRLSALLASLPNELAPTAWIRDSPSDDPIIRGISYDSRAISPGDLFVALRGEAADGHAHLSQALGLGAVALLIEAAPADSLQSPAVVVPDTRRALAHVATRFFGEPAAEMTLVGITGTNGKTSVSYLVESILTRAKMRVGLVGTVEVRYASERLRAVNTTPESLDLQRMLRSMRTQNIEAVAMEVSSHGLELGRVNGCRFSVAAFTNLTQDHLDFHGTMDSYLQSKVRLFEDHLVSGGSAVVNIDDPASDKICAAARASGARLVRVTRDATRDAEIRLLSAECTLEGSVAHLSLPAGEIRLELPLLGDFNLENLLVACGIAEALGIDRATLAAGVANCPQVPGRVERVGRALPNSPSVIVDYAHTPDAVDKLLLAMRPLAAGRLITVFGCGGDRDRAKRPLMAEAVARSSDRIIATSDNPRTEDPLAILDDVEAGLPRGERVAPEALDTRPSGYCVIQDRREAIELAVTIARTDDTVVIAGKGHEDYQIVGRTKLPFDDRQEALRSLRNRVGT
jgi:UDP-N-acetylmuramoyl-L-alanyl-D-glutamate--2,6-diaminopimelate ligase